VLRVHSANDNLPRLSVAAKIKTIERKKHERSGSASERFSAEEKFSQQQSFVKNEYAKIMPKWPSTKSTMSQVNTGESARSSRWRRSDTPAEVAEQNLRNQKSHVILTCWYDLGRDVGRPQRARDARGTRWSSSGARHDVPASKRSIGTRK